MKNFLLTIFVALATALPAFSAGGITATPGIPLPAEINSRLHRQTFQGVDLGVQMVGKKVQFMKAVYDFAKQGGASVLTSNVLTLRDVDGKPAVLPAKSVVKRVFIDTLTTPTASAVSGFTAPKFSVDFFSTGDLKAAALATAYSGFLDGIPVGTAATSVKNTSSNSSALTVTLTGGSVTAGKFNVFVEYYLSD